MSTRGKRYTETRGRVDRERLYTPVEAIRLHARGKGLGNRQVSELARVEVDL